MSNDEKKFKLDELPDQGSEPDKIITPVSVKAPPDPRLKDIKTLSHAQKDELVSQRWFFDKRKMNWGWLVALIALLALEKSGHMEAFTPKNLERLHDQSAGIINWFIDLVSLEDILRHPFYLAIFIPLLFKFSSTEGLHFEVTFSGIDAVKNISQAHISGPTRVLIKWNEMVSVEKILVNKREVLQIHNAKGPAAQLIWDIDDIKKKVIKQILVGLVSNKHPLRILIEKEVT